MNANETSSLRSFNKLCSFFAIISICAWQLCGMLVDPSSANAQDKLASVTAIDITQLPRSSDKKRKLFVSAENVAEFKDLLLAPLAAWIEKNLFVMRVVRNLDYRWELAPSDVTTSSFEVDANGSLLIKSQALADVLPFSKLDISQDSDDVRRAYKILWNTQFAKQAAQDLEYSIELSWIGSQSVIRKSKGTYFRRFHSFSGIGSPKNEQSVPSSTAESKNNVEVKKKVEAGDSETQAQDQKQEPSPEEAALVNQLALRPVNDGELAVQEVLQLLSPPVVFGYAQIAWRYWNEREDDLWIYSPVVGRKRRILSSNRGDPLLGGALTFDDFFVWSRKIQNVSPRVLDEKTLLVPFPSLSRLRLQTEKVLDDDSLKDASARSRRLASPPGFPTRVLNQSGGSKERFEEIFTARGIHRRASDEASMVLWNFERKQYPQLAAWVPATVFFVPRKVWILELNPKDPYLLSGRELLVVDQGSMLPVYKIVYNPQGEYQRTVLGAWGRSISKNESTKIPIAAFALSVQKGGRRAMAVTSEYARYHDDIDSKRLIQLRELLNIEAHDQSDEEDLEGEDASAAGEDTSAEVGRVEAPNRRASRSLPPVSEEENLEDDF